MKRYKAINFEYEDGYGTGTALDIVEHDEGEFVKYEDIKHLIQNTTDNSDYAKCTAEVLQYIKFSKDTKAGSDINEIIKKHFA